MTLTRHLYREDEVAAALMLCIHRKRVEEALFWALELLDSELMETLETALRTIWYLSFSATPIGNTWITEFDILMKKDEKGRQKGILELVAALARSTAAAGPGPRLSTGNVTAAHPPPVLRRSLEEDPRLLSSIQEWRSLTGRRARRLFSIPMDSLYWITARGRELSVYDTNEAEILGSLEKEGALWGSKYWDHIADSFGGWTVLAGANPVAREEFYDTYFPDDIPDEWSKSDRAKSHGAGVLQRNTAATCSVWLQRWYSTVGTAAATAASPSPNDSYKALKKKLDLLAEKGDAPATLEGLVTTLKTGLLKKE